MCVQDIDVQRVLQFTLIHAANCALHRHTSRVIHRIESFTLVNVISIRSRRPRQGNLVGTFDMNFFVKKPVGNNEKRTGRLGKWQA